MSAMFLVVNVLRNTAAEINSASEYPGPLPTEYAIFKVVNVLVLPVTPVPDAVKSKVLLF
jgi:hypothetical protein